MNPTAGHCSCVVDSCRELIDFWLNVAHADAQWWGTPASSHSIYDATGNQHRVHCSPGKPCQRPVAPAGTAYVMLESTKMEKETNWHRTAVRAIPAFLEGAWTQHVQCVYMPNEVHVQAISRQTVQWITAWSVWYKGGGSRCFAVKSTLATQDVAETHTQRHCYLCYLV